MTKCPHCGASCGKLAQGKVLLRVQNRTLVVHDDGRVEINCPECKKPVQLHLTPVQRSKRLLPRLLAKQAGTVT